MLGAGKLANREPAKLVRKPRREEDYRVKTAMDLVLEAVKTL
jgi:hypothetical protein